jgi:hypothetical protein
MTIYCPNCCEARECGEPINGMLLCPTCAVWLPGPKPNANPEPQKREYVEISGSAFLAGSLILTGIAGLVYFLIFFDATVSSGGVSVNNIGLLQERQNGLIVSSVIFLAGIILAAMRRR